MATPTHYSAVVLLEFFPAWLALSRVKRNEIAGKAQDIIAKYPEVTVRWFDADALGHGYTDFAFCEFDDLQRYHFLWEALRDTEIFTHPYATIKDVILGIESGYQAYEEELAQRGETENAA